MRHWLPILLVLPLAHCSCQRQDADTQVLAVDARLPDAKARAAAPDPAAAATARANAAAAGLAASTLHAYLAALPRADRSIADGFWSGGDPGSPAGDALLRGVPGLRNMKIRNGAPQPLDREAPPRAFEIPVDLRLDADGGAYRLHGRYRLRARIDGQGWEITSASLEPALD